MENIWPTRVIALHSTADMADGESWLSDEHVEQVRAIFGGYADHLDKPVELSRVERLLRLICLGPDGVGGGNNLLLRVTNTREYGNPQLVLAIVSYPKAGGSEYGRPKPPIRPGGAGDILDGFVQQLIAIPNLVPPKGDWD